MEKSKFIAVTEISEQLEALKSFTYKLVKKLNDELKEQGYLVVASKVSRLFFEERFYGLKEDC